MISFEFFLIVGFGSDVDRTVFDGWDGCFVASLTVSPTAMLYFHFVMTVNLKIFLKSMFFDGCFGFWCSIVVLIVSTSLNYPGWFFPWVMIVKFLS